MIRVPPTQPYAGTPGIQQRAGEPLTPESWQELSNALAILHTYATMQPAGGPVTVDPRFSGTPFVTVKAPPPEGGGIGDFSVQRRGRTSLLAHHFEKVSEDGTSFSSGVFSGALFRDTETRLVAHEVATHHGTRPTQLDGIDGTTQNPAAVPDSLSFEQLVELASPNTYLNTFSGYEEMVNAHRRFAIPIANLTWGTYQSVTEFQSENAIGPTDPDRPAVENDTWALYGSVCGAWNNASGDLPYAGVGVSWLMSGSRVYVGETSILNHTFATGPEPRSVQSQGDFQAWVTSTPEPFIYAWRASYGAVYPYRVFPE